MGWKQICCNLKIFGVRLKITEEFWLWVVSSGEGNMGFSRHILACSCIAVLGVGECGAIYSGEDPVIREVKDSIEALKKSLASVKDTSKETSELAAGLKQDIENTNKDIDKLKTRMDEESQRIDEKLNSIDKKIDKIEENAKSQGENEETKQLKKTVDELKAEMVEFFDNKQAKAEEQEKQRAEATEQLKSDVVALLESKQAEAKEDTKNQLAEATKQLKSDMAADPENAKVKEKLESIEKSIDDMKQKIEEQNLEAAKNTARLDKLERGGGSQIAGIGSSLLSGAISGGIGLLSNILSADSVKEKVADGKANQELTKGMNEEEKAEFSKIEADIREGKSDHEIQDKLDELKEKVATRVDKDSKFQQATFYGLNAGFKQRTLLAHVFQQARLGNKISAESVLSGKVNAVDTELIDAIYDMAQKNATFQDIEKYLKLVFVGSPRKVVKPKVPATEGTQMGAQPIEGNLQDGISEHQRVQENLGERLGEENLPGKGEYQGTPENAKPGEQPIGESPQSIPTVNAEYQGISGNAETKVATAEGELSGKTEQQGIPENTKMGKQPSGADLQNVLNSGAEQQEASKSVSTDEQVQSAREGEVAYPNSNSSLIQQNSEVRGASGSLNSAIPLTSETPMPQVPRTSTEQEGRKTPQAGQGAFGQDEGRSEWGNQSVSEAQKGGDANHGSMESYGDRQRRNDVNLPQGETGVRNRDISGISANLQTETEKTERTGEPGMASIQTNFYDVNGMTNGAQAEALQSENARRSEQASQFLPNGNEYRSKDRARAYDVSHQNNFDDGGVAQQYTGNTWAGGEGQNNASTPDIPPSRSIQNQIATPTGTRYQKEQSIEYSKNGASGISNTSGVNYSPQRGTSPYGENYDANSRRKQPAYSAKVNSDGIMRPDGIHTLGGNSVKSSGEKYAQPNKTLSYGENTPINDASSTQGAYHGNDTTGHTRRTLPAYEKSDGKQGLSPQKAHQSAGYDDPRKNNVLPQDENSYYGKQYAANYPRDAYGNRADISAEQKSASRGHSIERRVARHTNSTFPPHIRYQHPDARYPQDTYEEFGGYTNEFPEEFDMTLMDVDDNNYYDVSRRKFMQISRKSERFPKVTHATSMNVAVRPIDTKSERRAIEFGK